MFTIAWVVAAVVSIDLALAWKFLCAVIKLTSSSVISTFDLSNEPESTVPKPSAPASPTVAVPDTAVSTYVELGENYISHATQVVFLAFLFSSTSITLWTFIGKFLRKFATNEKFIKYFNYAMSCLLLLSIITFYI